MSGASGGQRCRNIDCGGTAVMNGRCLVHLGTGTAAVLAELTDRGEPLDVSGCLAGALGNLLDALPTEDGVPFCKGLIADGLTGERNLHLHTSGSERPIRIEGDLVISSSTLREVHLHEAHVTGTCRFERLTCESLNARGLTSEEGIVSERLRTTGDLDLRGARLGDVSFEDTTVDGTTDFSHVEAKRVLLAGALLGLTTFQSGQFEGSLDLRGAVLSGPLTLVGATVGKSVVLGGGELPSLDMRSVAIGRLVMEELSIPGQADFADAEIANLNCARARFHGQTDFSGTEIYGEHTDLSGVMAELRVDLAVHSDTVDLRGAHFRDGLDLRLGESVVRLDSTRFDAPSLVSGAPVDRAAVTSIAGARLSNLALSHIDLSNCLMEGAAELDRLKLGDGIHFPRAPLAILGRLGARGRQVLADDIEWRRQAHPRSAWGKLPDPVDSHPSRLKKHGRASLPAPPEIEDLYRSLRTARERGGNAPGAASFYYGEMEMRRLRPWSSGWDEKLIVWLYWAVSGYGLRASRALLALALLWACGIFYFLHLGGFINHPALADTLVFTASSGLSFLHEPPDNLTVTTGGEAAQLLLRIGTAVLLALATLALRGRVKR